ncbi:branched-chain amino acid aminotransferase II [Aspergillus ellipticus CBS 707.79]|uniref:Branched-chain-amino-acid aminotransferase n=1 Tax=Aspergillus ellipticus CBS 707.79 TaxID=1448320 RepID=A0A319ECJ6_9EURO|nr:branched-chain amino acid aminotransferase II [Aspergillus ellipticus CBS 707.79]
MTSTASTTPVGASPMPLDASRLIIERTTNPQPVPSASDRLSSLGSRCTDHMITVKWNEQTGWSVPKLEAYGPLTLMPTASVLHYATECFEGMKVYRGFDGKLRLFRPECNTERMLQSATRISLPAFDPAELQKLIVALLAVDGPKFLPNSEPGTYLYIRPTLIGTTETLNPQTPRDALLYIVASYFTIFPEDSATGLKLLASEESMVRAWPGGFGFAKIGANYGPAMLAQRYAKEKGYQQVLWLLGEDGQVTEAGASNFFLVWRTRDGVVQIVTPPLDGKIILDGVTRRSVLDIAKEAVTLKEAGFGDIEVVEQKFTMQDLLEASQEDRLLEGFAVGTAFFIVPVDEIGYQDNVVTFPGEKGKDGEHSAFIKEKLRGIMLGLSQHEWGFVIPEEY